MIIKGRGYDAHYPFPHSLFATSSTHPSITATPTATPHIIEPKVGLLIRLQYYIFDCMHPFYAEGRSRP